ncbi:MAG: IS110 family transposase [Alphaproteobacteria bacterium]|nr:IS110 family transposase [Alphaproteobacteria bacterium]
MAQKIRFVGIDALTDSGLLANHERFGKFEFYAFCSITGQISTYKNTENGHEKLIKWLGSPAGTIIALEPTGGYEWALWQALDEAGFDARQVSAAHVRAFARASGALAKTDPIDAKLIADFIAFRPDAGRKVPLEKLRKISALASKRRQLVDMKRRLSCQVKQRHMQGSEDLDGDLMMLLKAQPLMVCKQTTAGQ